MVGGVGYVLIIREVVGVNAFICTDVILYSSTLYRHLFLFVIYAEHFHSEFIPYVEVK